jgi:hypothetical protein
MRPEMLATMTVAVLFCSSGSDGWTCTLGIKNTKQCILGEMVNFQKVNSPFINKGTFTLAKLKAEMQLKMIATNDSGCTYSLSRCWH